MNALSTAVDGNGDLEVFAEGQHGQVWDTSELSRDFEVVGFAAPLVVVRRKSDGVRGSLMFQATPRFYFGGEEHRS